MTITVVFDPPLPSDSPSTFNTKAFTLLGDLNTWSTQANAMPASFASSVSTALASPPAVGSATPAAGSFTALTATSLNSGPLAGFRNRIINGGFDVWQRGTSFAANVYNADRWQYLTDGTVTVSQQAFAPGTAGTFGFEAAYYLRAVRSATGTYGQLIQRIEDVRTFAGSTCTLSFWVRADAATSWTPTLVQGFGIGGSTALETFASASCSVTTSWTKYSISIPVPPVSGKTIGASSFLELRLVSGATLGRTIDICGVQLEPGSVATPFESRPIGIESAMCKRYTRKQAVWVGTSAAHTCFPIDMRITPTSISGGGAGFASTNTTADTLDCYQTTAALQTLILEAEL